MKLNRKHFHKSESYSLWLCRQKRRVCLCKIVNGTSGRIYKNKTSVSYLDELVLSERGVPLADFLRVLHVVDKGGGSNVNLRFHAVDFLAWKICKVLKYCQIWTEILVYETKKSLLFEPNAITYFKKVIFVLYYTSVCLFYFQTIEQVLLGTTHLLQIANIHSCLS